MTSSDAIWKWQTELLGVCEDDFKILTEMCKISPAILKQSLILVKDWYGKQPHLPNIEFDDRILKRLLAANRFSVEKTKRMLDNMFTSRNLLPEYFSNRDPLSTGLSIALNSIDWGFIPKLTSENYRIHFVKINGEDPDTYDPETAFAVAFMVGEVKTALDAAVGDVYVWDFQHLKLSHVVKITPLMLKKTLFVAQSCYGSHIKGLHIVNIPPYAEFLINVIKSMLKKKIADRVHSHRTPEDLQRLISKEFIPKDMGGDFPKTRRELADLLRSAIKSPEWRQVFLETMEQKSDESKRAKNSETKDDELQGMGGTFRTLEID